MASILKVRDADGTVHEIYSLQGKSAYAYAVEGGYTGTEAEFAVKMAQEKFANPNALTFTGAVTGSYDGSAPVNVEIPSGGGIGSDISLGLTGATVGQIAKITEVDGTGKPTAWGQADMPDKLPNPNALTFTGAVTGSYDGSEPLTVNIPSSAGGSGGSGGLPNWRLIKTLVFSSEIAEIIFSEDDNGEAFAVKEIMIVGTAPSMTSGGYLYCGIAAGGINAVWPTAGKEMRWWLASVSGALKTMLAVSNTAVTLPTDKNFGCPSDIVTIRVGASQGFTADGTLYVYGR